MSQSLQTRPANAGETAARTASSASDSGQDKLAAVAAGSERYLTFLLAGEMYALPILDVVEIIEYRSLTPVPMMPAFIRGVLNLRGGVVPVVDLAAKFGRDATEIARRTSILIVDPGAGVEGSSGRRMGILVDAVNKVLYVAADDIEPPPALGADLGADVVKGMARHNEEFIVILNLAHVLSDEYLDIVTNAMDHKGSDPADDATATDTGAVMTTGQGPTP